MIFLQGNKLEKADLERKIMFGVQFENERIISPS